MSKILRGILYFLIVYSILWIQLYYSLDEMDQITIKITISEYLFGKGVINCDIGSNLDSNDRMTYEFFIKFLKKISIPFYGQDTYDKYLRGMLISGVYFGRLSIDNSKLCDKLYWYDVFRKYKINTPEIYMDIDETGKPNQRKQINNNDMYIAKPLRGTVGIGMHIMPGNEVAKFRNKNYIIQKLLVDCHIPKEDSRCYRYVTLYGGRKFILIEKIKKNNKICNNSDIGNVCYYNHCHNLTDAENREMTKITNQLANLHKTEYNNILSIGWDIMIDCDGKKFKMYVLEGNVFHDTYIFELTDRNKQFIKQYKQEALEFYKKHNLA